MNAPILRTTSLFRHDYENNVLRFWRNLGVSWLHWNLYNSLANPSIPSEEKQRQLKRSVSVHIWDNLPYYFHSDSLSSWPQLHFYASALCRKIHFFSNQMCLKGIIVFNAAFVISVSAVIPNCYGPSRNWQILKSIKRILQYKVAEFLTGNSQSFANLYWEITAFKLLGFICMTERECIYSQ